MRPLSHAVMKVTSQNFSRKYIAIGRIVDSWSDIVGKDFALKAQPARIQYRNRAKGSGEKPDAILEIGCSSADATMLHYQKDLILERINRIFGDQWITGIKFVPVAVNTDSGFRKSKIKKRPLTGKDTDYLNETLASIGDEAIKQRLESLGKEILMED